MSQALFSSEPVSEASRQFFPPKVFAQPFRLAFKNEGCAEVASWIEIRSLEGLRRIFDRVESGELEELGRFATVEMQLWGHLAEHSGFLRAQGNASTLSAGIQPLGEGLAPLAEDLSALMGGDDMTALAMLGDMKKTLGSRPCSDGPMEQPPVTHEFVKPDGVNLTENGEDALRDLVFGPQNTNYPDRTTSDEAKAFHKAAENAMEIFLAQTPPATPEEREAEAKEAIDCTIRGEGSSCKRNATPPEGPVVIGAAAATAGRMIDKVCRGLDVVTEADKMVQSEMEAAGEILKLMIEVDQKGVEEAKRQTQDLLERFGVTMEDLRALATAPVRARVDSMAKSKIEPDVAAKASRTNLQKLMKEFSEIDFAMLVGQSEVELMTPEQQESHQRIKAGRESVDRPYYEKGISREEAISRGFKTVEEPGQTYGPDHYKPRKVTPASEVPTDQDERAKWLAAGGPTGEFLVDGRPVHAPAPGPTSNVDESRTIDGVIFDMDEMRRLSGLDKPKSSDENPSS